MKPPQPPSKHHFIPQFYLRAWTGEDGRLERFFKRGSGELGVKRAAPAAMGWERDLYRAPDPELDPWRAQALEENFFSPLDAAAARCMQRLNAGDLNGWTSTDRTTWAMFLMSLFHRTPEHLEATMAKLREIYDESSPTIEARYAELRAPTDPETFDEWERKRDPQYLEKAAFRLLPGTIDNRKVGEFIINVQWGVIDITGSDHPLLISDNPIIFRPLKLLMGHIGIPISPYRLFLASEDLGLFEHMKREGPKQVARVANHVVVGNANRFVGAVDRRSLAYIQKHYGARRLGSLATGFRQPES